MSNKLLSATLTALITTASLAAPAAAQVNLARVPQTELVASSRTVTATRLLVSYAVNGRRFTMVGDRSNPDVTRIEIKEGSRVLVRGTVGRDGSGTLTNHLGRTYSAAQLALNPGLYGDFDFEALIGLDPTALGYLVTGQGGPLEGNPICLINPWVAFGCIVGAGIGAFMAACDPYLSCDQDGCVGGFNCGD